jgi:putative transposase
MPSKNTIKTYVDDGYYHIFNRGVEKRSIYLNQQDYDQFLCYLNEYLQPKDDQSLFNKLSCPGLRSREKDKIIRMMRINNFNDEISLIAYALMPNHFHLLVKQKNAVSIDRFMRSLCTRYVLYFNRKYQRVGPLFQGVYKAVLIENESHYLHLSRYIHAQALRLNESNADVVQPSSYPEYIGDRKTAWVHPEDILSFFSNSFPALSYAQFVSDYRDLDSEDL